MKNGKVYLVGAGPAGKDWMTVKGLGVLRAADVVIYDYLVDKELLAETKPGAELFCCDKLGKKSRKGYAYLALEKISGLTVAKAKEGKLVVRLKNGDPFIFSRAVEEMEALRRNRVGFEVVPGITAAQAAACFSGIPLTDRRVSSSVVFVTGQEAVGKRESAIDWEWIAGGGTIVLYMAVKNITKIAEKLIQAGKSVNTPVAAISNAGKKNQRTAFSRLKDISRAASKAGITAPAIFIIGETVALRKTKKEKTNE